MGPGARAPTGRTDIPRATKYLSSQFGFLFSEGDTRENLAALFKYFAFLVLMITVYAVLFHVIMGRVEGRHPSRTFSSMVVTPPGRANSDCACLEEVTSHD